MTRNWRARDVSLPIGDRVLLMGILNITPDSFSDGGQFMEPDTAAAQAERMAREGADILDIGGESTRPGSVPLSADDEWRRLAMVLPAVLARTSLPVSIDTYKAATARKALEAGAAIVNDVWGFQKDADMARVVADFDAGVVLMHNRTAADSTIRIMDDVVGFLSRSVDIALAAGIGEDRIVLDPGVGFGKTVDQSAETIARLGELRSLGFPVLLGASRKRFIGHLLGIDNPADRLYGTLGAHLAGVMNGAAIVRAHDTGPHREALDVFRALRSKT
jgi:dihydropteroate synthase